MSNVINMLGSFSMCSRMLDVPVVGSVFLSVVARGSTVAASDMNKLINKAASVIGCAQNIFKCDAVRLLSIMNYPENLLQHILARQNSFSKSFRQL